jgi:diguanylate cyclase (GGDEF)-like protein/PAS domain S-box-containing protein
MKLLFQEAKQAENLYRQILDNALDPFIAFDQEGIILDWNRQAEKTFGWRKKEVLGKSLAEAILPPHHRPALVADLERYRERGEGRLLNRRIEIEMLRRDGRELRIELTVTPIVSPGRTLFFASLRDISERRALEAEIRQRDRLTTSILNSMAGALVVADADGRLTLINPAGQRMLGLRSPQQAPGQTLECYTLFHADGRAYALEERPLARALRGEHVDGLPALIRHAQLQEALWVSANARPLLDSEGRPNGAVVVFHDISELHWREQDAARYMTLLQEQASLLDLAHDAVMSRNIDDVITYWNRSAEKLYGYSREEAIGQVSHVLLQSRFPMPLEQIRAILDRESFWQGKVVHVAKDGRELIVQSEWALERRDGQPYRCLETNADITQQVRAERALKQSQQDFRMLVEGSTDYAIIMLDPQGTILSWNTGAERIFGRAAAEAIGMPGDALFTREDREAGEPLRELEKARGIGRAENDRWHLRQDDSRFWATGVVTPLWNEDGSLRGYVKIMRDQTEHRLVEEQTQFLAHHDMLTGLPNRVHFSNQLHQALALSQRRNMPMALLLLDLDRFKTVNDTFGHHVGDLLLQEVALRIRASIRETDFVARLGGDEFVIIQGDVSQPQAAETLARKLILELGRPYQLDGQEVASGTSVGIGFYPGDADNPVELLKRADLALYRAKEAGRHTYQVYTSELFSAQAWKKDREAALRAALQKHQFELHYQPQIDLSSWTITSVEALLRWRATEMEMVLPGEFLQLAEETGLIIEIGEWALREACHQVRLWQGQGGLADLRLSINCSARQFGDPRFVTQIPAILRDAGMAPSRLELEVPEAMLSRYPEIKEQLSELRALGIRLTIDNFGTGATALTDFQDFEIDVLKIDKTFVQHLPHRREDSAITSAIISLAHNLGINVTAGGVETAEQLAYLKARDCTSAQGFIFSPPVPAEKFEELMQESAWSRMNRMPGPQDAAITGPH